MSYSMSPPQKPAPSAPHPQYPNAAGTPTNLAYGPPPTKRQRMSPDPRSPPNGAVGWGQSPHGLPTPASYNNAYGPPNSAAQSPYTNSPTYASPREHSFNMPQPYPYQQQSTWQSHPPPSTQPRQSSPPSQQSRDAMPPPPVPKRDEREERVGVEDIGDSLFGSGINLKDEENYLHAMYNNRHQQFQGRDNQSFSTNQNTSFGSSTMSPNNSFNLLTQSTSFGSQDAGTLGRAKTEEEIEVEQRRKREVAARAKAEREQHHLNNQFLQCNIVRKRLDEIARAHGVRLNMQGVFLLTEPQTSAMVNGAGNAGIVATKQESQKKPESVVYQNTPFDHISSLLSLAAGERARGLLDEAFALARARRYGDHGRVVPAEFADIAEGDGKSSTEMVVPQNTTGTQWDKVPHSEIVPAQEPTTANGISPASATPQPQSTVAFQGTLNAQLRAMVARDRQAEAERNKKRAARKRKATELANSSDALDSDVAVPESLAATVDQPKMTKKEQMRQNKEKNSNTEAQLHHTTNQTAMMAAGKKMKKYSWMEGAASSTPTNRYAKPTTSGSASGTATPTKAGNGATAVAPGGVLMTKPGSGQGSAEAKAAEWGDWRETGKGIELRDWVLVVERDTREKMALTKALLKLGS